MNFNNHHVAGFAIDAIKALFPDLREASRRYQDETGELQREFTWIFDRLALLFAREFPDFDELNRLRMDMEELLDWDQKEQRLIREAIAFIEREEWEQPREEIERHLAEVNSLHLSPEHWRLRTVLSWMLEVHDDPLLKFRSPYDHEEWDLFLPTKYGRGYEPPHKKKWRRENRGRRPRTDRYKTERKGRA